MTRGGFDFSFQGSGSGVSRLGFEVVAAGFNIEAPEVDDKIAFSPPYMFIWICPKTLFSLLRPRDGAKPAATKSRADPQAPGPLAMVPREDRAWLNRWQAEGRIKGKLSELVTQGKAAVKRPQEAEAGKLSQKRSSNHSAARHNSRRSTRSFPPRSLRALWTWQMLLSSPAASCSP